MKPLCCCLFALLAVLCAARPAAPQEITNPTLKEARELHGKGDVAAAIVKYQQVADESKIEWEVRHARFAVAACFFSMREFDAAVAAFEQFAKDFPEDAQAPLALVHAGNCFLEQERVDEAKTYYTRALSIQQPEENMRLWIGWANLGMGKVLYHNAQYEAALAYLEQAITRAPETKVSNEARDILGDCLDALRASGSQGSMTEWIGKSNLALGKLYQDERGYQQAVEFLQRALATTTDGNLRADCYVREAECLFMLGRTQEALTAARSVAQIQDKDLSFLEKRSDWIVRGACWGARSLLRDHKAEKAVEECDAVLTAYPTSDPGLTRELTLIKANALVNSGNVEQAVEIARGMRAQNGSDSLNALADELVGDYYLQVSRYQEAISAYLGVISNTAGVAEIEAGSRYKLAFCYLKTGNASEAQGYLRQIVERYAWTSWKSSAEKALQTWFAANNANSPGGEPR